ncbi:MAG: S8 family serine peptidase, partial [Chloroflexi bacterium]|nr:S8 family serine peptidase [Chloroflexota bacterium]
MEPLQPVQPVATGPSKATDHFGLSRIYRLKLAPDGDVLRTVASLSARPEVEYAEPDYLAQRIAPPDDPRYGEQWALAKIQIEAARAVVTGTPAVLIAVVDSGVDLEHPDLSPSLWVNPGEIPDNGIDDDGDGYVDDVRGWNFIAGSNDVLDDSGHGTLVAGIAAARTGNGVGVAGVCGNCGIMPVKVMQPSGAANYSDMAAGIAYATAKGARVINLSLGGYADSRALRDAISSALVQDVVVVGGAGNDNTSSPFYPAAYEAVVAVAGTTITDTRAGFSNYGSWVDVAAPGANILTTAMGGDYLSTSGTSMAAPFASGLAGLLLALHPDWGPALVRSQLKHTADSIDSLNPGYSGQLGSGRINAGRAVQPPQPILTYAGFSVNSTANGRVDLGASASLAVALYDDWADAAAVTGTLSTDDAYVTVVTSTVGFGDIASGKTVTVTGGIVCRRVGRDSARPGLGDYGFARTFVRALVGMPMGCQGLGEEP